ncbi:MAG: serine/threonine protein kinase [Verrucomicrobia bacterium]|nr:serine/threonine protein kinase [Verrucomicrobiota bacterium]
MSFLGSGNKSNPRSGNADSNQFGPFRLHELINSGGMADIWLATNDNGDAFALRKLHENLKLNFTAKRRFIRGARILSQIHSHDNVIAYYGHGKIGGVYYMLMEYIESSNLRELLNRADPLLDKLDQRIIRDMALALEHMHDSGFMHLDFKPENIIITRNGKLRLVDFDMARPKPDKPKKLWKYPGTPSYMAPEMLRHRAIDHRADIFAFGVTAYEVLTRRRPFIGESQTEVLRKQLDHSHDLTPLRQFRPDLGVKVENVILKCLERNPDKRYPHMSVVMKDLHFADYD